ncbi:uncharacterized protein [Lepeophtheirus salmonis]|uniref:uncharacterized protein isoform X2 n=1 Tax=Lepeophtheirus salmonis TaxID=72036 RepID=UPI001AEADFD6|nr:uncharacterized protein LOC121117704 isoform X2 [Lepeophtheirus salmonis]
MSSVLPTLIIGLLILIKEIHPIAIKDIWVPDVIENGTETSAVLDCVYDLNEEDIDFLEVKWYFRYNQTPIYQWIPPQSPQVPRQMKQYINTNYRATSDPLTMHRALHLKNLSTKLSGRYSCRVSSNYDDDFKSGVMVIYQKPREMKLHVIYSYPDNSAITIKCSASQVYPEPQISLYVIDEYSYRHDITKGSERSLIWEKDTYHMTISKQLTIMELWSIIPLRSDNTNANRIIVCQLTIPGTKVKEERREPLVEIRDGYLESSPRIFPFVSSGSMKLKCTN